MRERGEEFVFCAVRHVGELIEPRVLDRHRRAPRDLGGERHILVRIRVTRTHAREHDRADETVVELHRRDDPRTDSEHSQLLAILGARHRRVDVVVGDGRDERQLAVAPRREAADDLLAHRIDMSRADAVVSALFAHDVDRAPVGEPRHDHARDLAESRVVVERAVKRGGDVEQK